MLLETVMSIRAGMADITETAFNPKVPTQKPYLPLSVPEATECC